MTANEGLLKGKWVYFLRPDEKVENEASKVAESLKIGRRVKVGIGLKSLNASSCSTTEEVLDNSVATLFMFISVRFIHSTPFIPSTHRVHTQVHSWR